MYSLIGLITIVILSLGLFFILGNQNNIEVQIDDVDCEAELAEENPYRIPTLHEVCLENYEEIAAECEAFKNNDPSICDNLLDKNVRAWCKAKVSGDNSYCSVMDPDFEDHEDCYIDTAKTVEDCEAITSYHQDYERAECLAIVTKDASLCIGPDHDKIVCEADANDDPLRCDDSPAFLERWDCKIGLQHDEPGLCEEYHVSFCDEFYPEE